MFNYHPRIDLNKWQSLSDDPISYIAVAHLPLDGKRESWFYNGSATGAPQPRSGKILRMGGERKRMRDHRIVLNKGHEEIKQPSTERHSLWEYEKMTGPGATSFSISINRYPLTIGPIFAKTQCLALASENITNIILGVCLPTPGKSVRRSSKLIKEGARWSSRLAIHLRPTDLPDLPGHRANKVLPLIKILRPALSLLTGSADWDAAESNLRHHWQGTRALRLEYDDQTRFLEQTNRATSTLNRHRLIQMYESILGEDGF